MILYNPQNYGTIESNFVSWITAHKMPVTAFDITDRFQDRLFLLDLQGLLLDYAMGDDWLIGSAVNHNGHGVKYKISLRERKSPGMQICVGRIADINNPRRRSYLQVDFDMFPPTNFGKTILHAGELIQNVVLGQTTNQTIIAEGLVRRGIDIIYV